MNTNPQMSKEQAIKILTWHAKYAAKGQLALSCLHDCDFETAFRTMFDNAEQVNEK